MNEKFVSLFRRRASKQTKEGAELGNPEQSAESSNEVHPRPRALDSRFLMSLPAGATEEQLIRKFGRFDPATMLSKSGKFLHV